MRIEVKGRENTDKPDLSLVLAADPLLLLATDLASQCLQQLRSFRRGSVQLLQFFPFYQEICAVILGQTQLCKYYSHKTLFSIKEST